MELLNLNKKNGDVFSAADVNMIGAAIDQHTREIEKLHSMMYWYVDYDEGNNDTVLSVGGNMEMRQAYFDACGRIIVNKDGYAAKLNKTDSNYFADGTAALHDGSYGQTMAYRPPLYVKVVTLTNTVKRVYKSSSLIPGFTVLSDEMAEGAFLGSVATVNGKSCLMSIANTFPQGDLTMSKSWEYAQNYGPDWGLMNWTLWNADYLLAHDFCKDRNVRPILGIGIDWATQSEYYDMRPNPPHDRIPSGCTLSLGDASAKVNVTCPATSAVLSEVSLFGKESAWGKRWQWIAGARCNPAHDPQAPWTRDVLIWLWDENKVGSDNRPSLNQIPVPYGVEYRTASFYDTGETAAGVLKMAFGEKCDMFPTRYQHSLNETLNYACAWWTRNDRDDCLAGGFTYMEVGCAPGSMMGNNQGGPFWLIVPRLAYYGKLRFIDGKDLASKATEAPIPLP